METVNITLEKHARYNEKIQTNQVGFLNKTRAKK